MNHQVSSNMEQMGKEHAFSFLVELAMNLFINGCSSLQLLSGIQLSREETEAKTIIRIGYCPVNLFLEQCCSLKTEEFNWREFNKLIRWTDSKGLSLR